MKKIKLFVLALLLLSGCSNFSKIENTIITKEEVTPPSEIIKNLEKESKKDFENKTLIESLEEKPQEEIEEKSEEVEIEVS